MFKKSKKKEVKKVEKKVEKPVEKVVVKKPVEKVKKSFDVYNGKDIVRTFKKESVAKSWAGERGFIVK